jgi:hypothetical protein
MNFLGSFALSTLVLAFVVSCNPYYVVLVAPLSACSFSASSIENEKDESSWARAGKTVSVFLLTLGVIYAYNLLMLSPTLSAKWTVLEQTHGFL